MTKLDVLDGMETVQLAIGYRLNGAGAATSCRSGRRSSKDASRSTRSCRAGRTSTVGLTRFEQLPEAAQDYLKRIEEICGVPIDLISTGPDREQTIVLRHPFKISDE